MEQERAKRLPQGASQHRGAGPYSPVLEVTASKLVVISGQVAMDAEGTVVGADIKSQTRYTLENCQKQLAYARCTLEDVFKVNIFMSNLDEWDAMNEVYTELVPEPRPVRTAVEAKLLPGLLVEIEMWAAKK
ncbi:MAG: RidA family protein [Spirochaetaceae bacterium]|jgi:2-iminobutanoate/2-iminopropanoate deaminase|nr:RidA family protein [Spirochaetaceae bacterium]